MSSLETMRESEFHERVDALLLQLQTQLDDADADIDSELTNGILTLSFENGTKIIVNRQTPNREVWVAAKSGGFHFRFNQSGWSDTRTGDSLARLLSRVISEQASVETRVTLD
jgi:CyaY protein